MSKIFRLVAICLIAVLVGFSYADTKSFQSLTARNLMREIPVSINMPDNFVPPSYFARLELTETHLGETFDALMMPYYNLETYYYDDPQFVYFWVKDNGEEVRISPYMECVKKEKNSKKLYHIISIIFINDKNKVEYYKDDKAWEGPATNSLKKKKDEFYDKMVIIKRPRW